MFRDACEGPCPSSSPEVGENGEVAVSPYCPDVDKPGSSGKPGKPPKLDVVELRRFPLEGRPG